jgi:uncharacterized membrane protein YfcA
MTLSTVLVLFAGVVIGLLLGLTGGGGSILTVPLLVYVVGLDAKIAIATSLLVVGLASLAALIPHSRTGNVRWKTGIIFGCAGMVGAYSGGRLAVYIADVLLLLLFAGVMIGSGVAMVKKKSLAPLHEGNATADIGRSWTKIIGDGFVVGIVTGLVGAGGGFLVVPALALLGGLRACRCPLRCNREHSCNPGHSAWKSPGQLAFRRTASTRIRCFCSVCGELPHRRRREHSGIGNVSHQSRAGAGGRGRL